ncbi:MAG: hypothetical protein K2X91_05440, partial [Thermoleophilia bacterium]|nr:hypothetical protein [Thermoleophilia bacterium]
MAHRGGQLAEPPPGRPEGEEVGHQRDTLGIVAVNGISHAEPLGERRDDRRAVAGRLDDGR